ncbi:MAG: hypothetical protein ACE5G8_01685 [Anaerolineae bacterium]
MIAIGRSIIQYLTGAIATVFGLLLVIGITLALAARLLGIDPEPYILQSARLMSGGKLIDFEEAFKDNTSSNPNLRVCEVQRLDTDGDGFREWLVFYQFDTMGDKNWKQPCPDHSPRAAAIYDNDRGEPAVLFPYKLQPPDGDYLGEWGLRVASKEIVPNFGAETTNAIPELLFYGNGPGQQLTIFQFQQNTAAWESPTNQQPRYRVIGAFTGSGGVHYKGEDKTVEVFDRGPFDRSQLAIKHVYQLHGEGTNQTYLTEVGAASPAPPVRSTIDFGINPPQDIFNTEFPEKIVLGFYQTLDPGLKRNWKSADFLAPDSEAAIRFKAKDWGYFGFPGSGKITNLSVTQLQYFPDEEQLVVNETIEGPQPRFSRVEIMAAAVQNGQPVETGLVSCQVILLGGQWKINRCQAR